MGARRLAFACASVLLIGAAAGCTGSSSSAPAPSPSSAAPARGAATNLDYSQGVEDPTSVSCPSASFCMAVLGSGYAAMYDGTTWSRPVRLSSSAGEPDSVSCPTASFCMAVDAQDSSALLFNGSRWSSAPSLNDPVPGAPTGMASVSCSSPSFCAAVDNGSSAFTFNGTSWSPAAVIACYLTSAVPLGLFCRCCPACHRDDRRPPRDHLRVPSTELEDDSGWPWHSLWRGARRGIRQRRKRTGRGTC